MAPYFPDRRSPEEDAALHDCLTSIRQLHGDAEGWIYLWQPRSAVAIEQGEKRNATLVCSAERLDAEFLSSRWEFEAGLPRALYLRQQTLAQEWPPKKYRPAVAQMRCVAIDIDSHKEHALASPFRPGDAALLLKYVIEQWELPQPNHIDYSGNGVDGGIYARWMIEPLPGGYDEVGKANYRLWSDTTKAMVQAFRFLNADPRAMDASRVLRVPGSLNEKYVDRGNGGPSFREVIHDRRIPLTELARALDVPTVIDKPALAHVGTEVFSPPDKPSAMRSHEVSATWRVHPLQSTRNVLNALQRHRGGIREGHRNTALFWFVLTLRNSGLARERIEAEARQFASYFVPPLPEVEVARQITSGLRYPPYKLSYASVIEKFDISPAEQAALGISAALPLRDNQGQTIPENLAVHRAKDRARVQKHRRAKGILSRSERAACRRDETKMKLLEAKASLLANGELATTEKIAQQARVGVRTVRRYLKSGQ